jgi:hypothetical protein
LKIIDPGIVPEKPSSPNVPLNVAAALLLGLVLPVLYLTLAMNYQEQRAESRRTVYRAVPKRAMNSPADSGHRVHWLGPAAFGAWAAAIAIAPDFTTKAVLAAPAVLAPLLWWTLYKPSRWLALFFAAALLLPPLPIPIGDSGPHPCLIFAGLRAVRRIAPARGLADFSQRTDRCVHGPVCSSVGERGRGRVYSAKWQPRVARHGSHSSGFPCTFSSSAHGPGPGRMRCARRGCFTGRRRHRRCLPAWISTSSFPRPPAMGRNSFGWIPASTGAHRACFTRPARWAISARSFW